MARENKTDNSRVSKNWRREIISNFAEILQLKWGREVNWFIQGKDKISRVSICFYVDYVDQISLCFEEWPLLVHLFAGISSSSSEDNNRDFCNDIFREGKLGRMLSNRREISGQASSWKHLQTSLVICPTRYEFVEKNNGFKKGILSKRSNTHQCQLSPVLH